MWQYDATKEPQAQLSALNLSTTSIHTIRQPYLPYRCWCCNVKWARRTACSNVVRKTPHYVGARALFVIRDLPNHAIGYQRSLPPLALGHVLQRWCLKRSSAADAGTTQPETSDPSPSLQSLFHSSQHLYPNHIETCIHRCFSFCFLRHLLLH